MIRNNYFRNDERRATAKRNMGAVRRLPTTPAGRKYCTLLLFSIPHKLFLLHRRL